MNIFKPFKALTYPFAPLVPDCSYCAAMRFSLLSAVLTGVIFGIGLQRIAVYTVIGFMLGLFQVVFLWAWYHLTVEEESESEN